MDNTSDKTSPTEELRARVHAAFARGDQLDLMSPHIANNDVSDGRAWGTDRTVDASWLLPILLSARSEKPNSAEKLVIRGARVSGKLDLGCGQVQPFLFVDCRFDDAPNLSDCAASFVGFVGCWLPGLEADRLRCDGPLWLNHSEVFGPIVLKDCEIAGLDAPGVKVTGAGSQAAVDLASSRVRHDLVLAHAELEGTLNLLGAEIEGRVDLTSAQIRTPNGKAIQAEQSNVHGSFLARGATIVGTAYLEGAVIRGHAVFNQARIESPGTTALNFDHSQIDLGFSGKEMDVSGRISMHHARVECQVSLMGSKVSNPKGTAIRADHIEVNGSLMIGSAAAIQGTLELHAAKIECVLNLHGLTIETTGRPRFVIDCDQAEIRGDVRAGDVSVSGPVNFRGATVSGDVRLSGGTWKSQSEEPAMNLDFAEIRGEFFARQNVRLIGGITAHGTVFQQMVDLSDSVIERPSSRAIHATAAKFGAGLKLDRADINGTVDLAGALVSGDLRAVDAKLRGTRAEISSRGVPTDPDYGGSWRGVSLRLRDSSIEGDVNLQGSEILQTVDLMQATVEQTIDFDGSVILADQVPAIAADELKAGAVRMNFRSKPTGAIYLRFAEIVRLIDSQTSWPEGRDIAVAGMSYDVLDSNLSYKSRLAWLAQATSHYAPQPYEQLAASYDRDGQPSAARRVRYEAMRRIHKSGNLAMQVWGYVQDITIGYGYRPLRALSWAIAAWVLGALYFVFFAGDCGTPAVQDSLCPVGDRGPDWSPFMYSFDLILPFASLGHDNAWDPSGVSRIVMVALTVTGWLLLTVVAAAIARTLKRS